jgi:hypothetical protein
MLRRGRLLEHIDGKTTARQLGVGLGSGTAKIRIPLFAA